MHQSSALPKGTMQLCLIVTVFDASYLVTASGEDRTVDFSRNVSIDLFIYPPLLHDTSAANLLKKGYYFNNDCQQLF